MFDVVEKYIEHKKLLVQMAAVSRHIGMVQSAMSDFHTVVQTTNSQIDGGVEDWESKSRKKYDEMIQVVTSKQSSTEYMGRQLIDELRKEYERLRQRAEELSRQL